MQTRVLIMPGYGDSDAQHWQSRWQRLHPDFIRVQQSDWLNPECATWVQGLEDAVRAAGSNVVLVAHSLSCLVIAHWAQRTKLSARVQGALLVAVPDSGSAVFPDTIKGFAHTPSQLLPFPSIVVASSDDPYAGLHYTQDRAAEWGSRHIVIGAHGHINGDSGLGDWEQGRALIASWCK